MSVSGPPGLLGRRRRRRVVPPVCYEAQRGGGGGGATCRADRPTDRPHTHTLVIPGIFLLYFVHMKSVCILFIPVKYVPAKGNFSSNAGVFSYLIYIKGTVPRDLRPFSTHPGPHMNRKTQFRFCEHIRSQCPKFALSTTTVSVRV